MRKRRLIIASLTVAIGLAGTVTAQRNIDRMRTRTFDEQLLYLPNKKLLNHFTGGMSSIVADMLWLKCIQYIAKHFRGDYKFTWLNHMCDTITRLDPYFADVYRFGGIFLAALKADDDASIDLLKRGMVHNPDNWELPHGIAMVYLLNRRDQPDSLFHAANFLAMAAETKNAPEAVIRLASGIQQKQDLVEVERNMWMNIARSSEDKLMRDLAERKLIEIELRQICGWLDEVVQQYAARHGRPPGRLADLVTGRLIKVLPEDPLGGRFFLDDAGAVQSTTLLDGLQNQHRNRLRNFLERFKKDHGRWPGALEELVDAGLTSALPPHPYKDRTWHYDPCTGEVY